MTRIRTLFLGAAARLVDYVETPGWQMEGRGSRLSKRYNIRFSSSLFGRKGIEKF